MSKQQKKTQTSAQTSEQSVTLESLQNTSTNTPSILNGKTLTFAYSFVIFMLFVIVYFYIRDTKIHLGGDNAEYYILAKSLAEGKGYSYIANIKEEAHNHFPPGYPFIMSILMRIFGDEQTTLTAFNGVFLLGSLLLMFNLFRRFTDNVHLAFAVCAACLFNYHIMEFSTIMMSEIPFLFFSCLTLWVFLQADLEEGRKKIAYFVVFLFLLAASFYIRTAGLSLVAGICLFLLLQKNWKYLGATVFGFLALVLPWQLRSRSLGGNSYIKQLLMINPYKPEDGMAGVGDMFARFGANVIRYISREIPSGIFPWLEHDPKEPTTGSEWLIGVLVLGLIVYGVWKMRNHRLLLAGYTLGSFGILLLWPDVWFGVRFVLPLLPFLLFFFTNGLVEAIKLGFEKMGRTDFTILNMVLPFILVLFIAKWLPEQNGIATDDKGNQYETYLPSLARLHNSSSEDYEPKYKNYFACAEWIKQNTPEKSVVCCRKQGLLYVNAGNRYVTGFKQTTNTDSLIADLKSRKVNYLVLDQLGFSDVGRYILPAVMANPNKFPIVFQVKEPDTYVLKFVPDAPAAAPAPAPTATTPPTK